jgi:hypothetical protein
VVLRFRLVGGNAEARAEAGEAQAGRSHYFHGSDPAKWRRDVSHFGRVAYREVYPGTDVVHYGSEGSLEHDFVIAPGADPSRIRLEVEGGGSLRLDEVGDLVMVTRLGEVRQKAPVAYQLVNGRRRLVRSAYRLEGTNSVGLRLGPYDEARPLVIDPVLTYSTFLGGSAGEAGQDVTVAPDGSLWFVGWTQSSDLPGALNGWSGDWDAFVSHLAPDGRTLLSTTYLGGGLGDFANRARATSSGVYVVGGTVSADFPSPDPACAVCRNPPPGLQSWELFYPPSDNQSFLAKIDATGGLEHVAVFGGSALDNAWVLGLDATGRVHVGSNSCGDGFPTTPGAYRRTRTPALDPSDVNNECDAAVARFTEGAGGFTLDYGTYLGGSGADFVAGFAVSPAGATWIVGGTTSGDLPTTEGSHQATVAGGYDAFLARLSPDGSLALSTYLGGTGYDYAFDVALDGVGSAYVAGRTESSDFPTTIGALQTAPAGSSDGFVCRITSAGAVQWSTRLGGSGFDWPFAIAVQPGGSALVTGRTDSPDFPTVLPAQAGPGGAEDAFVARLSARGSRLLWSTLLGGPGSDEGHGLALAGQGGVWVAGGTAGALSPTPDALQPSFGGGPGDAFLARLDETASVRLEPSRVGFRPTRVGRTRSRPVVLRNNGRMSVDVEAVSVSGPQAADFASSSSCPPTLGPGASCTIQVSFSPLAAGLRSASLLVATSAAATPSEALLAGTAVTR